MKIKPTKYFLQTNFIEVIFHRWFDPWKIFEHETFCYKSFATNKIAQFTVDTKHMWNYQQLSTCCSTWY